MKKKVKVYSTPSCIYCNMLKAYLDENKIKYEIVDVSEDKEQARYIAEKTEQLGVPVIEIEGEFIVGFEQEKIAKLLGIS